MYFTYYQDARREWRWTLFAANHKKIADSGEGYIDVRSCLHGISLVKGAASIPVRKRLQSTLAQAR